MPKVPAVLTRCPSPVGGGIPGIRGRLQVRSVRRQQTVSLKTSGGAQPGGKPLEKRLHRSWKQLLPLLDKCRGRWCPLPVFEASDQGLFNAVFAHGEQQGYYRLITGSAKHAVKGSQKQKRGQKSLDVWNDSGAFETRSGYRPVRKQLRHLEDFPAFAENTCCGVPE